MTYGLCMRKRGVSILEVLIYLVAAGIIIIIIAWLWQIAGNRVKIIKAQHRVQELTAAITRYEMDTGTPLSDLRQLTEPGNAAHWLGPYVESTDNFIDPWGVPYYIEFSGDTVSICSSNLVEENLIDQ